MLITVGALYFGREILIPLALSILLSFVMTPPLLWLRRRGMPRIGAVIVVVSIAFAALGGITLTVGTQLVQLAENLPTYQRNIQEKLSAVTASAAGTGIVARVTEALKDLRRDLGRADTSRRGEVRTDDSPPRREPIPVVIEPTPLQPFELIRTVLGPLLGPLGTASLVVLFVVFILIEREELRDRFIKLVGGGDLQRSTEAITEAGTRVSRYLLMQLVVNVTYGLPIGLGLWLIGVPNAVLWGMLAVVLRFIPYLGPWIAALFPLTIAFGVDPGWSMLVWTIVLFLVVELVSNNAVEPWLYGNSTGLSSFAIILATIFWTLLWGPPGLLLATPLTVCLVVIGSYVPNLEFLGVLLGNEPVLSPAERLYQRLLAGNIEEAVEMAEQQLEESTSQQFYDDVAIPALRLSENDRKSNDDVDVRRKVASGLVAVVAEVDHQVRETRARQAPENWPDPIVDTGAPSVMCIGGRTELDLAGAEILAQRLAEVGVAARTEAPIAVSPGGIGQLDLAAIKVVCLIYFHARPGLSARYVWRRLQRRQPELKLVVCCWNIAAENGIAEQEKRIGEHVGIATSLASAEKKIRAALATGTRGALGEAAEPDRAARLVDLLRDSGLTRGSGEMFERAAAEVSEQLKSSVVVVVAADAVCQPGSAERSGDQLPAGSDRLAQLICTEVVSCRQTVAVGDVEGVERFAGNAELLEKGIRSFAAAPIWSASGIVIGALCVLESKVRVFSEAQQRQLEVIADIIARDLESALDVSPDSPREGEGEDVESRRPARAARPAPRD